MRIRIFLAACIMSVTAHADTIDHFVGIANEIPKMEMKAEAQSQSWARAARNVLDVTSEAVAETLMQANEVAKTQGHPLFCLPNGTALNATLLNEIILKTYNEISSQQSDKNKMTVSQVAWLGVTKTYPCQSQAVNVMQHVAGFR